MQPAYQQTVSRKTTSTTTTQSSLINWTTRPLAIDSETHGEPYRAPAKNKGKQERIGGCGRLRIEDIYTIYAWESPAGRLTRRRTPLFLSVMATE